MEQLKFLHLIIVCHRYTRAIAATIATLSTFAKRSHLKLYADSMTLKQAKDYKLIPAEKLPASKEQSLVVSIGGDGNFLSAAQIAIACKLPIVGINRGTLGFLADLQTIDEIIPILQGNYLCEDRSLLEIQIIDTAISKALVLNDVVFIAEDSGHIMPYTVTVDSQESYCYRADGLIFATPTGSTARALSAGGPIVEPSIDSLLLVPILSHNLTSRHLILKATHTITVETHNCRNLRAAVIGDGQRLSELAHDKKITIKIAPTKLKILHPQNYQYLQILSSKLHWKLGRKR